MTLEDIETKAKDYAVAREALAEIVNAMNGEIEDIRRRNMKRLKKAVAAAAEHRAMLKASIEDGQDLFVRPRTVVMHGIKLGIQKGKGKIEIEDTARTCKLIRKHFSPKQAGLLIATEETLVKAALNELSAADLRKIDVQVTEAGDQVVIKPADSVVDKLVEALLKAVSGEEGE